MENASTSNLRPEKSTNVRPGAARHERRLDRQERAALAAVRVGLRLAEAVPGDLAAAWAERLFSTPRRFARPQRERALLATARELRFSSVAGASGLPLHGWRWSATDDGGERPTVLLVHGWQGRGAQLGALVAPLVARGLDVLTFDGPAHGDSPGTRGLISDMARAIVSAARLAGGPLHAVVAHSMGAAATTIAIAHHDLDVKKLVYLAPPSQISRATRTFAQMTGISPELRRELERRLERRARLPLGELDGHRLATRMQTPLLVIHDEDDAEVPISDGRLIASAWPGAILHATSGLGHQRILRAPEVVAEVSRFVE